LTIKTSSPTHCHPGLCGEGETPHEHCVCGLPMCPGAVVCALCDLEALAPRMRPSSGRPEDPLAWDGESQPSYRRNRVRCVSEDPYVHLLGVVFSHRDTGRPTLGWYPALGPTRSAAEAIGEIPTVRQVARDLAGEAGERVLRRHGRPVPEPSRR
jgi:hypothetical protein